MALHHFLSIPLLCISALGASADLSGTYDVTGRNADGSVYSGTLALMQDGSTVEAGWNIGTTSYSGYGPLEGRVLTINWSPGQPPVVYVTMPDGSLHGTWADGLALEKATPR
ncbi:hypothetical protein [Primorskyibacter sp. 2E233]|uniref:hypothetical protein n=1 Tax=Primorskyibacter sp. 2E233 TaxID=3413431 RepID=UPI003BF2A410